MEYEYRIKRTGERWQRIDFDTVVEMLEQRYPHTVGVKMERIDQGDTVETPTMEIRKYDRSTGIIDRQELPVQPDGEILWV